MTTKKIIKYNNKSYTFHKDEDGPIHPSGEDYESVEYLIENRGAVVEHIAKKMNYQLPKKEICCLCNREVKKENLKKYKKIVEKYGLYVG